MQRKVVKVTENPEQGARLESLMEALNLTQVALAESLGFSQPYISQMVGGSRSVSRRVLQFITKKYPQVNIGWLMTGSGDMFLGKKEEGVLQVNEPHGGEYELREGRLEWQERKIKELVAENERMRKQLDKAIKDLEFLLADREKKG